MLLKVFATNVVISKGYDNAPAIRYSEKGDSVRFRIGAKQYDTRAENNTRWVNISVKAFGHICERIRKMDLKEGSYINLVGRLDEDSWTDQKTGETRSAMVIILDDVEFASGSG
ncbi:MAG: single-stranded DNA-binding protein, partial [Faecousia sp.]